jgi:lysophospholipase L1-like esterase
MRLALLTLTLTLAAASIPTAHCHAQTDAKHAQADPWEPAPKRNKDGDIDAGFLKTHRKFLDRAEGGDVGLLLLGDSITAGWDSARDDYDEAFDAHRPANFGIGGDRTEHVLWRIANGELDHIRPRVVMLMIGTNNISNPRPEHVARGVTAVVDAIREKLPESKILLLGIFPRGSDPADPKVAALRRKIADINAVLAGLDDGRRVKFLDIGEKFLDADSVLSKSVSHDALHLTRTGYKIWAAAVKPTLDAMMKQPVRD